MREYLTTTTSTCRQCGHLLPAQVLVAEDGVWLEKHCARHGRQEVRISSDPQQYLNYLRFLRPGTMPLAFTGTVNQGCPNDCGLCPEHEQHVCLPILEITDHCNLRCPICLVNNRNSYHLTPEEVAGILDRLIACEGQIDVLNLSGGEPTLNPYFQEIVQECQSRDEILRVSVSTNGLRLFEEEELLAFLGETNTVIALQYDGESDSVYEKLRGRPLADLKRGLIERMVEMDAPMTLTATVVGGVNEQELRGIVDLLFTHDNILSAMFQPACYAQPTAERLLDNGYRITIPEVIRQISAGPDARISEEDFSPLPCGHPACFALAFFLRVENGRFVSLKRLVESDTYLDLIQNRALFGTDPGNWQQVQDAVYELWSAPASQVPDSEKTLRAVSNLIREIDRCGCFDPKRTFKLAERSIKSVFVHHFMDRETFDLTRARKCCNVYPQPEGRMLPVCVRNVLGPRVPTS
jgi:uncharacterized radical SAM superfamily Fe-S cluster-containing enzyme